MHIIAIENAFSNGYHEDKIAPPSCRQPRPQGFSLKKWVGREKPWGRGCPAALLLPVTKKYGNRREPHACLVWVPEMEQIPALYGTMLQMRNMEKDF